MTRYLIIRRQALSQDSWTYGDWRQYVAFLDNDEAVCCRGSSLPFNLLLTGIVLIALAGMGTWVALAAPAVPVYWWRIFAVAATGFAMTGVQFVVWFTDWRLMVMVSQKMPRKDDGTWERKLS